MRKLVREISFSFLIFLLVLGGLGATAPKCGGLNATEINIQVTNLVSSFPDIIRTLFPNANPTILLALDVAGVVFRTFTADSTVSNLEKFKSAWRDAKGKLAALNNGRVNLVIAAIDILLGQIKTPTVPFGQLADENAEVKLEFKESDVKNLKNELKLLKEGK